MKASFIKSLLIIMLAGFFVSSASCNVLCWNDCEEEESEEREEYERIDEGL